MNMKKILIGAGILSCILFVFFFLVLLPRLAFLFPPPELEGLKRIERDTGLIFPTNSVVVHFVITRSFIDPAWVAKVTIPNDSSDMLIVSIKEKDSLDMTKTSISGNMPSSFVDWWKPKNKFYENYYFENQTLIEAIFSKEEDGNVAIYISGSVI